jgi:glutaredoxin
MRECAPWVHDMKRSDFPSHFPSAAGSPTLVLFTSEWCGFCRRVIRCLEDLGLTDVVSLADVDRDPRVLETLQSRTGRRTVPCLFIDDSPYFESRDIMQWLSVFAAGQA